MAVQETPLNTKIRVKIQGIIESNTVRSGGDFHIDELNEDGLVHDFCDNLKLVPRESGVDYIDELNKVIKASTKKVRGMINSKEFKQNIFLKRLHETFEIQSI